MKDLIRLSQLDILLIHKTKMEKETFFQVETFGKKEEDPQSSLGERPEELVCYGMIINLN